MIMNKVISIFNNEKEEMNVSHINNESSLSSAIESVIDNIILNYNDKDNKIRIILSFLNSYNRHHEDNKIKIESFKSYKKDNVELLYDFPEELKDKNDRNEIYKVYDSYNHKIFCINGKYTFRVDYKIISNV